MTVSLLDSYEAAYAAYHSAAEATVLANLDMQEARQRLEAVEEALKQDLMQRKAERRLRARGEIA